MPDTIERLRSFDGGAFPVISLYLGLDPDPREARSVPARLKDLLEPLVARATVTAHAAQMSLRDDVERVLGLEDQITDQLGHAVAIFACRGRNLFELLSLPVQIADVATTGSRPYLRPLDAALNGTLRTCAVLVHKRNARFYELTIDGISEITRVVDRGQRTDRFAGWYGLDEHTVRNHAEEVAHRQFRDIVQAIRSLHRVRRFDAIILGGRSGIGEELLPFLDEPLKTLVIGTFTVDAHAATPAQVAERCAPVLAEHRLVHQHRVVKEVIERAHRFDTALGLRATLEAANANAIDTLVLDRNVAIAGVSCPACSWLGVDGRRCQNCDTVTTFHHDVLDELARRIRGTGGTVEQVATGHALGNDGVIAKLRFPLDLPVGSR